MAMKFSNEIAEGKLSIIQPAFGALAASSGFFTFKGAALGAVTFAEKGGASIFAIASSIAIYTFWTTTMHAAREWDTRKEMLRGMGTVFGGMAFIVALSSTYNVAGIDRGNMLEHHQQEYISAIGDKLNVGFQDTQFLEGVASELRQNVARYESAEEDEIANGTISGTAGKGAVSDAMGGIASRLEELLNEVVAFQGSTLELSQSAMNRLEKIRQIHKSEQSLPERTRLIENESDALRNDFARMDSDSLSEAIKRTLTALPGEVDLRANFSGDAKTRKLQEAALDRVRSEVRQTTSVLSGFVTNASSGGESGFKSFEGISATRAVLEYWPQILPQWAGGLALDATPLAILILMLISMGARPKSERMRDVVLSTSIGDVMRMKAAENFVRTGRIDAQLLHDFERDLFGGMSDDDGDQK